MKMGCDVSSYERFCRPSHGELLRCAGLDVVYERGQRDTVWLRQGGSSRPVLDFVGGYGTNLFGHAHPELVAYARELLETGVCGFVQNSIRSRAGELARGLVEAVGPYVVTFTNSGTETIEAALKHAHLETGRSSFWALKGAFHGKTTGAVQLTWSYHSQFRRIGPRVRFLDPHDLDDCRRAEADAGDVAAVFVEPIQGEGGVRGIPAEFVKWLQDACARHRIPIVVDEIQTGMGRTGTFLGSQAIGLVPDYICLGKALGGGLAKIGALLVAEDRYEPDFSLVHTSTFAEDDWSCAIALRALELIERDRLPDRCAQSGTHLLESLNAVKARYGGQVQDVRGRGLMIAIELKEADNPPSALLQMLCEQKRLGYFAAAYLLRAHGIRVLPTMSDPLTLRIQPSAYVERSELDRLVAGLDRWCEAIRAVDMAHVTRHFADLDPGPILDYGNLGGFVREAPRTAMRVGFVAHPVEPEDVVELDPSLGGMGADRLRSFLESRGKILEPTIFHREHVRSATGEEIHVSFVGLSFTASQIMAGLSGGDWKWMFEKVERAAELAKAEGCQVIGFGGHASILTSNCERLGIEGVSLTSGNALTVGMGLRALRMAARERGIELAKAKLAVVGAAGNIASMYALMMAPDVAEVILVVRQPSATVDRLRQAMLEAAPSTRVTVSTEMSDLRDCALIVGASSATQALIKSVHLANTPVVICDIAVPSDVDSEILASRKDVTVIRGGLVRLPKNADLSIPGLRLPRGHVFACMAETLLLGLERGTEPGSQGALTSEKVERLLHFADKHGFALAGFVGAGGYASGSRRLVAA